MSEMILPPASRRLLICRSLAHSKFSESPFDFTVIAKQLNCNMQHVTKTMSHELVAARIICMSINTNTNSHTITCYIFCFLEIYLLIFQNNFFFHTARIIQPYQLFSQRRLHRNCSWCEMCHLRGGWITVLRHPWLLNLKQRLEYEKKKAL